MLISVVIPVYNTEKYLHECINSVINQSYENIQIILVDDGSTDECGELCDFYSKTDSRVVAIHQENKGQFSSRLEALKIATGDYYVFLDSDDKLRTDALDIVCKNIIMHKCDLLLFEASRDENFLSAFINIPLIPYKLYSGSSLHDVYNVILGTGKINSMCIQVVKKGMINLDEDYSEFYKMRNAEDSIMSMMIMDNAESIMYIDEILYYYRCNGESVSYKYQDNYFESLKKAEIKRREYSKKWFGEVIPAVYNQNIKTCFHCLTYELVAWKNSFLYVRKRILRISCDEFTKTSHKFCTKNTFSATHRFFLNLLINMRFLHPLIICAYKLKMMLRSIRINKN